jgi:thiol-disulfide isomerase/thioredoxin
MLNSGVAFASRGLNRRQRPGVGRAVTLLLTGMLAWAPVFAGDGGAIPLSGATRWLNSAPLDGAMLGGKVVLVDFWTYSCSNCLNALPYVKAWDARYRARGLVVIGVHTPEFDAEREQQNVERALSKLGVTYPVAMDNRYSIWNAFGNKYWPAQYLIDARGRLRYRHYGEGAYREIDSNIQTLLREADQGSARVR